MSSIFWNEVYAKRDAKRSRRRAVFHNCSSVWKHSLSCKIVSEDNLKLSTDFLTSFGLFDDH